VGGPLDGQDVTVRTTDGFLAADKAAGLAWMYKRRPDGRFAICTDHDNSLVYPHGPTTGQRAIDWERLPRSTDSLPVISLGDTEEAHAGDPLPDPWDEPGGSDG
jgi:hypothetical protein